MISKFIAPLLLAGLPTLIAPFCHADVKITIWNLEHLSIRPTKDFQAIAKVAKNVDFLAVQEFMNKKSQSILAEELTKQTDQKWSFMASHAVGRSSYKEMYGFVRKDDTVAYEDSAVSSMAKARLTELQRSSRFRIIGLG